MIDRHKVYSALKEIEPAMGPEVIKHIQPVAKHETDEIWRILKVLQDRGFIGHRMVAGKLGLVTLKKLEE